MIIGGVAASLLGRPRLTVDLDAVILLSLDQLSRLIESASLVGIVPRIKDAETFARINRVLLLQHENSGINVDFSLGVLPFEAEMVERGQDYKLGEVSVRLPTP